MSGISFSFGLYNYAKSKGYSHGEVRDFLDDDAEKAKLRTRVTSYFNDQGLDPDTPNALCAFGQDQITQSTQVGKLIRSAN